MATKQQQQDFLAKIGPMAKADMEKTGILASLTIAQAICESGWGLSGLTKVSNNLFGIKGAYNGQSVLYKTQEWDGSKYVEIYDNFKLYPSWAESLADHSAMFLRLSRYQNLIGVTDYRTACRLVKEDGYATSPTYTQTLTNLIESYGLTVWDDVDSVSVQPSTLTQIVLNAGSWNLRKEPSMSGAVTGIVYGPAVLETDKESGGWYHTAEGWVGPAAIEQVVEPVPEEEITGDTITVGPVSPGDFAQLYSVIRAKADELGNIPVDVK